MTKEKLEEEAIAKYKTGSYPQLHPDHFAFIHGYLTGAEPREKRITELETRCNELFLQTNEQAEQIKKIKSDVIECFGSEYNVLVAKLLNKWEIKE